MKLKIIMSGLIFNLSIYKINNNLTIHIYLFSKYFNLMNKKIKLKNIYIFIISIFLIKFK